jgi:flavodoxin
MKALVVYYSRTANTRKIALKLAKMFDAEIEEIHDNVDRRGLLGYLRSASAGWFGGETLISRSKFDPSLFDIVIIGTPIWRFSVSEPVKQYIKMHAAKFKTVAFFCTMGGTGDMRAFRQMQNLCGKGPLATMAVKQDSVITDSCTSLIEGFVQQVRSASKTKS